MSDKIRRTEARRLRGFRDLSGEVVSARERMIARIRSVYERYGFAPLETPALEYVECLGKFLPESDQPDAGIFSFRDEDEAWVALRYDLTAPLSRYVAMNINELPLPFRRYQVGPVWRVEKPGPGRFREFYQFDFDSVGTGSMLADAEACMIMAETLETLGIRRGDYVIRVNNRKVLNGVLERVLCGSAGAACSEGAAGPGGTAGAADASLALNVLRCIDKLDKVGLPGVEQLLGKGRKDESGAFIPGAGLPPEQIRIVLDYLGIRATFRAALIGDLAPLVEASEVGRQGLDELRQIDAALSAGGFDEDRVVFDSTVVRGLEYYTGPVFEGALTFEIKDEDGQPRQFGSVFGGGRYDDLVKRFLGREIPATGASIGVDRLLSALQYLRKIESSASVAPVLVTRLDKSLTGEYQKLVAELRAAGINAELYVGTQNIGKQFQYASRTGKIACIVMGSDELARGEVSIKDLRLGDELSKEVGEDRKKWLEQQPAQASAPRGQMIEAVRGVLGRYA
ncbi:MAG: histidine--tRNA ligase [Phycisphaerales bacterium]|nr:histidine--tRNA ligase [Phycisphaerales bacterium]